MLSRRRRASRQIRSVPVSNFSVAFLVFISYYSLSCGRIFSRCISGVYVSIKVIGRVSPDRSRRRDIRLVNCQSLPDQSSTSFLYAEAADDTKRAVHINGFFFCSRSVCYGSFLFDIACFQREACTGKKANCSIGKEKKNPYKPER